MDMYTDLTGKNILIFGAASRGGIGFAAAQALAACGCRLHLADKDAAVLDAARETGATGHVADSTVPADLARLAEELRRAEPLDGLVQCAGILGDAAPLGKASPADWTRTLAVNCTGSFHLLQAILPLFRKGRGSVVTLASGAGKRPLPDYSAYSVSKAALIMMTKCLAVEYGPQGLRANAVCPGPVISDMLDMRLHATSRAVGRSHEQESARLAATMPLQRLAVREDVVNAILFLLSDASSYMTGQALNVSGGMITEL